MKNGTLLVEVEKKKRADFQLKMIFPQHPSKNIVSQTPEHKKGCLRSKELPLCTVEEI